MIYHLHRARYAHERRFTERLSRVLLSLGHRCVELEKPADFAVQWGAARLEDIPTLHCELGWMPRWEYQVSWHGINAAHTHAGEQEAEPESNRFVHAYLNRVRVGIGAPDGGWGYCDPKVAPTQAIKVPFYLCPLQVPEDSNMKHLPIPLRTPQGMIDAVTEYTAEWKAPVYFKQHPARSEKSRSLHVKTPNKLLLHTPFMQVASLLKSPQCLGVIAGNSNTVHDAILWEKWVRALGNGFWGDATTFTPGSPQTLAYVEHVAKNQWSYKRLYAERVAALMEEMPNE